MASTATSGRGRVGAPVGSRPVGTAPHRRYSARWPAGHPTAGAKPAALAISWSAWRAAPVPGILLQVATTPDEDVPTPDEQLVAGYVANTPDGAYYNTLMDALRQATPEAVTLLVEIAERIGRVDDDQALCDFGAGPLETFLTHSGSDFVRPVLDGLTSAARSSDKFRQALKCVWWTSDLDPQVVAWLRRFCPPPIDG